MDVDSKMLFLGAAISGDPSKAACSSKELDYLMDLACLFGRKFVPNC